MALVVWLPGACGGGPGGKLAVDTPILPYVAPDIDEITGIDPDAPKPAPKAVKPEPAATAPTPAPAQPIATPPAPPAKKP